MKKLLLLGFILLNATLSYSISPVILAGAASGAISANNSGHNPSKEHIIAGLILINSICISIIVIKHIYYLFKRKEYTYKEFFDPFYSDIYLFAIVTFIFINGVAVFIYLVDKISNLL